MATPTAMKHASSQQGRTPAAATPPVSTPFSSQAHAAFSPLGPRSSPHNVKKSPANSATLMGHTASSSGIPGGGSGGPGSMTAMNYDSPAAAAMGAMALDLGGLDSVSASGLAQLGAIGLSDDDDRERRLKVVLELLKANKGRVSEAGLERLAKSMGLECLWEEAMGGKTAARTLIIAGSALALEIVLSNNTVESVSVTFPESRNIVLRHVQRADKILLHDLQLRPTESPLTKSLERFAANLAKLAVLEKLSVEPGLNLYEAIAGIYETLDRLHQWDLQKLRSDPAHGGESDAVLARTAQCLRLGRPTMYEHGHLGLSLDYWKRLWRVPAKQEHARPSTGEEAEDDMIAADDGSTWSIFVGCAPLDGSLVYQPVRVSDKWLSDAVEKDGAGLLSAACGGGSGSGADADLDWLEPENTFLPLTQTDGDKADDANGAHAAAALSGGAKLPDVRFNAVFHPPLTIPLSEWQHMSELVGLLPEAKPYATFDSLFFPIPAGTQHDPSAPRIIHTDMDMYSCRPLGDAPTAPADSRTAPTPTETTPHRHSLFIYKPVYGCVLSELPFSHPKQLVHMLPVLRQYAFLTTLLENAFGPATAKVAPGVVAAAAPKTTASAPPSPAPFKTRYVSRTTKVYTLSTTEDEFATYARETRRSASNTPSRLAPAAASSSSSDRTSLDVVLTMHPMPRLQVVFPFGAGTADVVLEIGPNAQVHVISQNIFDGKAETSGDERMDNGGEGGQGAGAKSKGRRLYAEDLGRMLEVCEDLGVWCEWIRSRCTTTTTTT